VKIRVKKVFAEANLPTRANDSDAGYDLYSTESLPITPSSRQAICTGICVEIPKGYYGRIAPRSGLALKAGVDVLGGVIDSGYRDEIKVILINLGETLVSIDEGDRIAQLIIEKCEDIEWENVDSLNDSERGESGFGSSGQ
tara:strand:- start:1548 stop:1970 length:423 start_codon:yes stop_codon:yes gene_type:complete